MLDEILDRYPISRAVFERLQGLLAHESAIAFVGAGASYPLYPLWTELFGKRATEEATRGLATDEDSHTGCTTPARGPSR